MQNLKNFRFLAKIFNCWAKWSRFGKNRFLRTFSILEQNFEFGPNFEFFVKISMFFKIFRGLPKISTFAQNYYFWPKLRFSTKISIFDQNYQLLRNNWRISKYLLNHNFHKKGNILEISKIFVFLLKILK